LHFIEYRVGLVRTDTHWKLQHSEYVMQLVPLGRHVNALSDSLTSSVGSVGSASAAQPARRAMTETTAARIIDFIFLFSFFNRALIRTLPGMVTRKRGSQNSILRSATTPQS
jgi:hypothetical protein